MDRLYRVHGYIMCQCNHFYMEHDTANIWRLKKVKSMKVADLIKNLDEQKQSIVEKYCENCQQWDCDECPYEMGGDDND